MPDAYDYFLRGDPDDVRLQLIEVSHPSWQRTYRYIQNIIDGVTVTHEDGTSRRYDYSPITIKKSKADDSLDQSITIAIGDLGLYLPDDIDRLRNSAQYNTARPTLNYREYLLSDLTTPIVSVTGLEVTDSQPNKQGASFVCKAKELNLTKTGVPYTLENCPTLRLFL